MNKLASKFPDLEFYQNKNHESKSKKMHKIVEPYIYT